VLNRMFECRARTGGPKSALPERPLLAISPKGTSSLRSGAGTAPTERCSFHPKGTSSLRSGRFSPIFFFRSDRQDVGSAGGDTDVESLPKENGKHHSLVNSIFSPTDESQKFDNQQNQNRRVYYHNDNYLITDDQLKQYIQQHHFMYV
jgi:hypothetical protein